MGTTFISQNVLRTTLLLSPLKANCLRFSTTVCDTQFALILFFVSFFGLMFNLRGPQGQNPRITCGPRTTVWETLLYALNHHTATHGTITLDLIILRILSRYCHLKAEDIQYLYSWRWVYWCPKHVETITLHTYLVVSSRFFAFTMSMMHGQINIRFVGSRFVCRVVPPYLRVICTKTYRSYVKPRIIPNAIYNVIFV
jgi:hypothetical protein